MKFNLIYANAQCRIWYIRSKILLITNSWPTANVCDAGPTLSQRWFNIRCLLGCMSPANRRHWANVDLILAHHPRLWANIKSTLVQCPVISGRRHTRLSKHNTFSHLNNFCTTFDVGSTLYKCYSNVLCLLGGGGVSWRLPREDRDLWTGASSYRTNVNPDYTCLLEMWTPSFTVKWSLSARHPPLPQGCIQYLE